MKRTLLRLATVALLASGLLSVSRAAPSAVSIRVEAMNKTENEKNSKSQRRALKVHITNGSQEAMELKVKYAVFGRDVVSRDVVTIDQGERPASVAAKKTEIVETPAASAESVEEHREKKKKVEASGSKIIGHGVQVLNGETLLAEAYDPPSIKEEWGKAPKAKAAAKEEPKKKK